MIHLACWHQPAVALVGVSSPEKWERVDGVQSRPPRRAGGRVMFREKAGPSSTCSVCQKHQILSATKKMRGFPEMEIAGFGDYV